MYSKFYSDGMEAGKAAGSWVIDGNTTEEQAARILRGIKDCDPEVMDIEPSPLSGEWSGESIYELIDGYRDMSVDEQDEATQQYEEGFSLAFWGEVERAARYLTDPSSPRRPLMPSLTASQSGSRPPVTSSSL